LVAVAFFLPGRDKDLSAPGIIISVMHGHTNIKFQFVFRSVLSILIDFFVVFFFPSRELPGW